MFREMRRKRQALSEEASIEILERCTSGVLAVAGDDGYPYAVPMSYVYHDGKLYFHCAEEGHKIDAIAENDKVSFCVIDKDQIVEEEFTTYFRSVIVFGRARVMSDGQAKISAMRMLADKYSPNRAEARDEEIQQQLAHLGMIELTVEHISGKEAIELVKQRQK